MDSSEFTSGRDDRQIEIDRRRVSAVRDLEDALDRARDDLAFEIIRVIRNAIDDVTGDDPSACASFTAEQAVKRDVREYDGVIRRAWCAFSQAFAP
jgi:hypothetical protein